LISSAYRGEEECIAISLHNKLYNYDIIPSTIGSVFFDLIGIRIAASLNISSMRNWGIKNGKRIQHEKKR
jgi:hypothetical protein